MGKRIFNILVFIGLLGAVQAQKGDKSIAAGPLVSFPSKNGKFPSYLETGVGLEAIGQYNCSNKSALQLQSTLVFYGLRPGNTLYTGNSLSIFSLRGGYRYRFGSKGFFLNAFGGIDNYSKDDFATISFALGTGKRFTVKEVYFIDPGLDYIFGDTDPRLHIKAIFSLLRRPKED